jgi:hypothetical protein
MLAEVTQGALGALMDRPQMAQALAATAAARLGLVPDEQAPQAGIPAWKLCAAAGGTGLLAGIVLGVYLAQRHHRYVPNLFGR